MRFVVLNIAILFWFNCYSSGDKKPLIYPIPSNVQLFEGRFYVDKNTVVVVPEGSNKEDEFLVKFFHNELADKYDYSIGISTSSKFSDKGKYILIGSIENQAVKNYCEKRKLLPDLKALGSEGYILSITANSIVVAANNKKGALLGLQSLRQLIKRDERGISFPQLIVKDAPKYPFRGIKLYLPGKENIQFFKRFIKDFVSLYKFNKIILELNANMRLDKHPELNIGAVEFARHLNSGRLDRPPGVHNEYQNSSHQDNADGQILEKEEVADIVNYIRKFNIEVIPELPSLTHSYYLLYGHRELAENLNQPFPDTYCPLKPEIYKIYFDVLDEYINVIHPTMIHVGHDEWRMEKDVCELCRDKDYGVLYANDLKKIHDYLATKNIKTAIWGDHLLESVTEKNHQTWKTSTGYQYKIPGALRPEQVIKLIPKDIIIFNWFWDDINNDRQLADFGFKQVYGNLRPEISNWNERNKIKGVSGGAPSSWAATTEFNIGKDQLFDFLSAANLLWSENYLPVDSLAFATETMLNQIYQNLSGRIFPSDIGASVTTLNISSSFNFDINNKAIGLNNSHLLSGDIKTGNQIYHLASVSDKNAVVAGEEIKSVKITEINKDVSSILFLHACAKEALNDKAYGMIYNFDDTAEPIGWYEIVYEDGMIETIPVRYGVNILDWEWRKRIIKNEKGKGKYSQNKYAYNARAVECSADTANSVTFFSFEWKNARFGKKIKEVKLHSLNYNNRAKNMIVLLAVSISEFAERVNAKGTEAQ